MKAVNHFRCCLMALLLLLAGFGEARAQCRDTPPAGCPTAFEVFDAGTGEPLQSLCVGQRIRVTITCPERSAVDRNALYYQFLAADLATAPCTGYTSRTNTFTVTQAGKLTIAENAQNPSNPGTGTIFLRVFDVAAVPKPAFQVEACAPGSIRVTISDQAYDTYTLRINTGPLLRVNKGAGARNYPIPGGATTGQVVVKGRYNTGQCVGADSIKFTTLPLPSTPVVRRLVLSGTTAQLQFEPAPTGYQYVLEQADATSPSGYRIVPQAVLTTTGASVGGVSAPACYRLRIQDVCTTAGLPASTPVCSVLLSGTSDSGQNTLTWTTDANAASFVLKRDGQLLTTLPANSRSYPDAAVTCGVRYCYQLETTTGSGTTSTTVVSNETCLTTTSSSTLPVPQLVASFTPTNQVLLTATVPGLPAGGRVRYLRTVGQGAPTEFALTARRTLRDSTLALNPEAAPCYQAQFVDDCGNRSALSAPFCPVVLSARAADLLGNTVQLNWTELRGPDPAASVQYAVQVVDASGAVLAQPLSGATASGSFLDLTPPADRQLLRYRIAATSPSLSQPSYSNVATVSREMKAMLPTAFTPNGDGLNDVLEVKGRFLSTFTFTIVDRNGQQVFRGTDRTQVWDGRVGATVPVPGAYVWRFEAVDETGKRVVQHGTITILR
ncbi:T9SS type B sorting domain-containing protein [Hymenobacter elongatus]|nr:gliding motility-associated C-terminal domain-containing protein [Hymenobacter elongatus]